MTATTHSALQPAVARDEGHANDADDFDNPANTNSPNSPNNINNINITNWIDLVWTDHSNDAGPVGTDTSSVSNASARRGDAAVNNHVHSTRTAASAASGRVGTDAVPGPVGTETLPGPVGTETVPDAASRANIRRNVSDSNNFDDADLAVGDRKLVGISLRSFYGPFKNAYTSIYRRRVEAGTASSTGRSYDRYEMHDGTLVNRALWLLINKRIGMIVAYKGSTVVTDTQKLRNAFFQSKLLTVMNRARQGKFDSDGLGQVSQRIRAADLTAFMMYGVPHATLYLHDSTVPSPLPPPPPQSRPPPSAAQTQETQGTRETHEAATCVLCMSAYPHYASAPCGHRLLCVNCYDIHASDHTNSRITRCPLCRSQCIMIIRVY